MEVASVPNYSVIVAHRYLQPAGTGSQGSHAKRYHMYVTANWASLKHAVEISYTNGLSGGNVSKEAKGRECIIEREESQ